MSIHRSSHRSGLSYPLWATAKPDSLASWSPPLQRSRRRSCGPTRRRCPTRRCADAVAPTIDTRLSRAALHCGVALHAVGDLSRAVPYPLHTGAHLLRAVLCRFTLLHVVACRCMPLHTVAHRGITVHNVERMWAVAYRCRAVFCCCILSRTVACRCLVLHGVVRYCVLVHARCNHCVPFRAVAHGCVPLRTFAYRCMPFRAVAYCCTVNVASCIAMRLQ